MNIKDMRIRVETDSQMRIAMTIRRNARSIEKDLTEEKQAGGGPSMITLNPNLSATRIGQGVYVHATVREGSFGELVTAPAVRRVLAGRARNYTWNGLRRPVVYRKSSIQIGCQKFYLTRIRKLLSLFP